MVVLLQKRHVSSAKNSHINIYIYTHTHNHTPIINAHQHKSISIAIHILNLKNIVYIALGKVQ